MPNQNFEKIYSEVKRFLTSSGLEEAVTNNFKCGNPMQYVWECYTLLKEVNLLPKIVKKTFKSDKLSAKHRTEGNNAFRQKNYMKALECYTKAVACAPADGKELALAFANRSAVTFSLEEYECCVNDVDRALSGNYPEKLKYKLLERKGKCLMKLSRKDEARVMFAAAVDHLPKSELDSVKMHELKMNLENFLSLNAQEDSNESSESINEDSNNLPELSHPPSHYIQVASKAVDICFTNIMGRHIVAATDLNPGDVIAVEKPYASVLLPVMYTLFCFMCKKRCHSLLPCRHCTEALFCSEKCRTQAWEQEHCIECDLLPTLLNIGCEHMELLAVKILLQSSSAGRQLLELLQSIKDLEIFQDPKEKGFTSDKYLSDDYKSTHNLEMNDHVRYIPDIFRRSLMASCILYALEECTNFFTYYQKSCAQSSTYYHYDSEVPGGGMTIAKSMVGALILRHLLSVPCNAHEVSEMRLTPKGEEYATESVEVGGAIYPFLSLINHSCDPNVVRHNYCGDIVALIAIKAIKEGEQIFDNYGYHHAIHSKDHRQTHLLSQYFFVCKCEACLYDWPLYANLPEKNPTYYEDVNQEEIEKSSVKFKTALKEINAGKTEGKLPFLYKHLTLLHNGIKRPWKEYNQCQEAIKQCLSVQANHYLYKCAYSD